MKSIIPTETIENKIFLIRGQKVMLDRDLAALYGVKTKYLNQQVNRNIERFPSSFMFRLTTEETTELVANCNRFASLKHSRFAPYAFTEHGVAMLASVLKSKIAVKISIRIIETFIRIRQIISGNNELSRRLDEIEKKYDAQFKIVFDAIRELMSPAYSPKKQIGFTAKEKRAKYLNITH